jgi:ribonuclease P protein component
MLKKANRLHTNFEFNVARKYGVKSVTRNFVTYVVKPTNYVGPTRVGIVVPNKLHTVAAHRNRAKRVIREYIRQKYQLLPNDLWIVIHVINSILELKHEETSAELDKALQKVFITH